MSRIACRSAGPARATREAAANVRFGVGSWGGQRPRLGGYVTAPGPAKG